MPQMAPINWLSMFFIFSLTFIMFNMLNYYYMNMNSNMKNKSNSPKEKNNKILNWKW